MKNFQKLFSLLLCAAIVLGSFDQVTIAQTITAKNCWFVTVLHNGTETTLYPGESLEIKGGATIKTVYDSITRTTNNGEHLPEKRELRLNPLFLATIPLLYFGLKKPSADKNTSSFCGSGQKILLIDLQYPYGKQKVYMNTSLWTVGAGFEANGFDVQVVDLNIDSLESQRTKRLITEAAIIGFSPTGGPNARDFVKLCKKLATSNPTIKIIAGGQWVNGMEKWEFDVMMGGDRCASN